MAVAKWTVRVFCTLISAQCIGIIFVGAPGWEVNFTPPKGKEVETVALAKAKEEGARAGVLFEHSFQLGLCFLALMVNELGDASMQRVALLSVLVSFLGATIGMVVWLPPIGYAPESSAFEVPMGFAIVTVLSALLLVDYCMAQGKRKAA